MSLPHLDASCVENTPIGTSARKHLVNPEHVVWVDPNPGVEAFLADHLDEVLVSTDTGSLKGLARDLYKDTDSKERKDEMK
jgi:hypothetical protein